MPVLLVKVERLQRLSGGYGGAPPWLRREGYPNDLQRGRKLLPFACCLAVAFNVRRGAATASRVLERLPRPVDGYCWCTTNAAMMHLCPPNTHALPSRWTRTFTPVFVVFPS